MLTFGPVPSRRLGRSIGINNIAYKSCSYSCTYCQLGTTRDLTIVRRPFFEPQRLADAVARRVEQATRTGEAIDFLTFVPDGEPTLDVNLGATIRLLKPLGVPLAILTNASLVWDERVRDELSHLDLVSLKIDAVGDNLWKTIDRPHGALNHDTILNGILTFANSFGGQLITETMLIGNTDYRDELPRIASFLGSIPHLQKAYVAIPTRPPQDPRVTKPDEAIVNEAFQTVSRTLGLSRTEYLVGYEGNAFSSTGDVVEDLLSIMSVHPMREEALTDFLEKAGANWDIIARLTVEGRIIGVTYDRHTYYMRKLFTPNRK